MKLILMLLFIIPCQTYAGNWNLLAGLNQPLVLQGKNIEINYLTPNWVFEYSHGWDLDFSKHSKWTQTDAENEQGLSLKLPYSTGGGIGYRITEEANLRLEIKEHQYVVTQKSSDERFTYITRSVGMGFYYQWKVYEPLGLILVPSIRYWPNVTSTLKNNTYLLQDGRRHRAHEQGAVYNISVGFQY